MKKIFVAAMAAETNVFSPVFTGLDDFRASFYFPPGKHPAKPNLCSAPFVALREIAAAERWRLAEGTAAWAEPGGIIGRDAHQTLRDEILAQLRGAMPVDAAVFGLHGAMRAQECPDCEGDLLARARKIVGPRATIAASYDPHSHFTKLREKNADLVVAFREFPHTDFVERARHLARLLARKLRGEIRPATAVFDCRMIDVMPTTAEPMRSFTDRVAALEKNDPDILSIAVIHGFLAGDSPDLGAKIVVVTDNRPRKGARIARELGMELFSLRGKTRMEILPAARAVELARRQGRPGRPAVVADVWDNPGGGVAGDSTVLLRELLRQGARRAALATIWDPVAVRLCFAAGEGATVPLRFGGKSEPGCGEPMDAKVKILRLNENAVQSFGEGFSRLGAAAAVEVEGVAVILNTVRSQTFSPDLLENMGIDPARRALLVVKSTNHFRAAFSKLGGPVFYADSGAPYPRDPRATKYRLLKRAVWPIVKNPHGKIRP